MSSKMLNSFAALCESDDDEAVAESVVAAPAPAYNAMTSEERVEAALAKVSTCPIPVLPPGGVNLLSMFPDLARIEYAMRRGMSWYDMFLYDDELAKFQKECDEREARGEPRYLSGPERPASPDHVIECDEWADVRRVKSVGRHVKSERSERSYPKQRRERRMETPEEREARLEYKCGRW